MRFLHVTPAPLYGQISKHHIVQRNVLLNIRKRTTPIGQTSTVTLLMVNVLNMNVGTVSIGWGGAK